MPIRVQGEVVGVKQRKTNSGKMTQVDVYDGEDMYRVSSMEISKDAFTPGAKFDEPCSPNVYNGDISFWLI